MRQTWRWFGPSDTVSRAAIRQAGATGVVTALHPLAAGARWSDEGIVQRQSGVDAGADGPTGLCRDVEDSLPAREAIKTQTAGWRAHLDACRLSMEARAGPRTVCNNFMAVLDWTRTDPHAPMPHGGTAMGFDLATCATVIGTFSNARERKGRIVGVAAQAPVSQGALARA